MKEWSKKCVCSLVCTMKRDEGDSWHLASLLCGGGLCAHHDARLARCFKTAMGGA